MRFISSRSSKIDLFIVNTSHCLLDKKKRITGNSRVYPRIYPILLFYDLSRVLCLWFAFILTICFDGLFSEFRIKVTENSLFFFLCLPFHQQFCCPLQISSFLLGIVAGQLFRKGTANLIFKEQQVNGKIGSEFFPKCYLFFLRVTIYVRISQNIQGTAGNICLC